MKNQSLKEKILQYLKEKYPNWVMAGDIEIFGSSQGRMYANAKRRVQELAQVGRIERRINSRNFAEFRYKFLATELPPSRIERPKEMNKLL